MNYIKLRVSSHFKNPISPEKIKNGVMDYFGVSEDVLFDKRRLGPIIFAKYAYVHCLWHYTSLRQGEIAIIAGVDRSMVSRIVKKVSYYCLYDSKIKKKIIGV